jgi:hypothetical protein
MAELLFITEGKSGREIAGLLGAGKETVQRWAREGQWMERRRLRRQDSPLAALERLRRERDRLIGTLAGEKTPTGENKLPAPEVAAETIGMIQKLTQTIEKMESQRPDGGLGAMLNVVERLATFTAANSSPEEALTLHNVIEKFLDEERRKSL